MNDVDKTIQILEKVPTDISSKISMRNVSKILNIMFSMHDEKDFEPTIEDFIEAFSISLSIEKGLDDIKNNKTYTVKELKKELGLC